MMKRALDWHDANRGAVLATVVETWGSAPRGVGSQLVIDGQGAMEGSVSGGCVEGAVIVEAIEALGDGAARLLTYGVSDDDAFAVGLACGGTIGILVEPIGAVLPRDTLGQVVDAQMANRPVGLIRTLAGLDHQLIGPDREAERFRLDRSGISEDGERFIQVFNPPLRLIIVGAVHIAQPLSQMAALSGYSVTIVDPRPAFASAARFPGHAIVEDWPDEAIQELAPDARTAVVTLTHDPKLDDPAIRATLNTDAFYLGCLGSKRTHAKRLERLSQAGVPQEAIDRIHAPVGLDLGGRLPAEIATSVLAEITQVLRRS